MKSHHLQELNAELSSTLQQITNLLKQDHVLIEAMKRPLKCLFLTWPQKTEKQNEIKSHTADVKQFLRIFANKAELEDGDRNYTKTLDLYFLALIQSY